MKIVKFNNGKYGITKGWWFWRKFLDCNGIEWWQTEEMWKRYCMFPSIHAAQLKYYGLQNGIVGKLTWVVMNEIKQRTIS